MSAPEAKTNAAIVGGGEVIAECGDLRLRIGPDVPPAHVAALVAALRRYRDPAGRAAEVFVATRPVDFRRGVDSFAALAAEGLRLDPFSGGVLVFRTE
ncbi:MAG: IS66 family insertion sequence element accessory protein TnpB [Paracoccaceae bacterium]